MLLFSKVDEFLLIYVTQILLQRQKLCSLFGENAFVMSVLKLQHRAQTCNPLICYISPPPTAAPTEPTAAAILQRNITQISLTFRPSLTALVMPPFMPLFGNI